jgi:hypothetical protein
MLELARAHVSTKLMAWVPDKMAGVEKDIIVNPFLVPPFPGAVPVTFRFADIDDDVTLSVDSHSSSPAFSAEAKQLAFDLVKLGAMSAEELLDHVDAPDPEELQAGIKRREAARAEAHEREQQLKLIAGSKHK